MKKKILKAFLPLLLLSKIVNAQCTPPTDDCSRCVKIDMPASVAGCTGGSPVSFTANILGTGFTITGYSWSPTGPVSSLSLPAPAPASLPTSIPSPSFGTPYTLTVSALGPEMISNGDFANPSPMACYATDYTYTSGGYIGSGMYGVASNPTTIFPPYVSMPDHSTPHNNMFVAKGSMVAGQTVWTEKVGGLCAGNKYNFEMWYANVHSDLPYAKLRIVINGVSYGPFTTSTVGVWTQINFTWLSGTATSAGITIFDDNALGNGNNFAIDDISFRRMCTQSATTVVTVPTVSGPDSVCPGSTIMLTGSVSGGSWSSSNTSVAVVDGSGVVTGIATGTANITYAIAGCTAVHTITVLPLPAPIVGPTDLCYGTTATFFDPSGMGTWSASPSWVATIGATTGVLTAVGAGSANVWFTSAATGCSIVASVYVHQEVLSGGHTCVGSTAPISVSPAGVGGTWSPSSGSILWVDASGTVHGVAAGTATVTFTDGYGCTATISETVDSFPVIAPGPTEMCVGEAITLSASPAGGTWSSSSTMIAYIGVVGGTTAPVIGVSPGTATITYQTLYGCLATTTVTVDPCGGGAGLTLCQGQLLTLTVPSSMDPGGTWSSSDVTVADINHITGEITAVGGGTAIISYTSPTGDVITATIAVTPIPVTCITYDEGTNTITITGTPGSVVTLSLSTFSGSSTLHDITLASGTVSIPYTTIDAWWPGAINICIDSVAFNGCVWDTCNCDSGCCVHINPGGPKAGSNSAATLQSNQFELIPNPNSGSFVLAGTIPELLKDGSIELKIMNMLGETVYSEQFYQDDMHLNKQINCNVSNGVYIMTLEGGGINQKIRFEVIR